MPTQPAPQPHEQSDGEALGGGGLGEEGDGAGGFGGDVLLLKHHEGFLGQGLHREEATLGEAEFGQVEGDAGGTVSQPPSR
ncbi:MAG: hypothetical protein AAF481_11220 [Acidobacteriota bacterium]